MTAHALAYLYREPGRLQLHSTYNLVPPVLGLGDFSCHAVQTESEMERSRVRNFCRNGKIQYRTLPQRRLRLVDLH